MNDNQNINLKSQPFLNNEQVDQNCQQTNKHLEITDVNNLNNNILLNDLINNNLNESINLNESSILINNLDIFKFLPDHNNVNMSKNTDDSLISNVLNNIDVSTYSTEKDIKDMIDANSQKMDMGINIDKDKDIILNYNHDTITHATIDGLNKINENKDLESQIHNNDSKLNDSKLSKNKNKKKTAKIDESKIQDDCEEQDDILIDGQNKSVMEISLDSIKNIQRIEETLTRKKIPQFIEFKTNPSVPSISKNKITNLLNFKTVEQDFKREMGKFFQDNG